MSKIFSTKPPHQSGSRTSPICGVRIFKDGRHEFYDIIDGHRVLRLYSVGAIPRHLEKAIREQRLHTIPKALITENNLNRVRGEFHDSGFKLAAAYGQLSQLPEHLLTARHLLSPDENGATCMLTAANFGYLYQVPRHFLTFENIQLSDHDGFTVAHAAACQIGGLRCIPRRFLTEDIVHQDSWYGYSPLHLAANSGTLRELPTSFWTLDQLFWSDAFGRNVFWHAATGGNLHGIPFFAGLSSHYAPIRDQVTQALSEPWLERKIEKCNKARAWLSRLLRFRLCENTRLALRSGSSPD